MKRKIYRAIVGFYLRICMRIVDAQIRWYLAQAETVVPTDPVNEVEDVAVEQDAAPVLPCGTCKYKTWCSNPLPDSPSDAQGCRLEFYKSLGLAESIN